MALYARLFASVYDRVLAGSERAGLAALRRELLSHARGRTLEVGAGTGLNLPHYPASLTELTLVEPDPAMTKRLERRVGSQLRPGAAQPSPVPAQSYPVPAQPYPVRCLSAAAERLPFPDDAFDTVVCTLVLCTVADPLQALREIRRVLVPGGCLLFLEHVRSSDPALARWQDRLEPVWRRLGRGCRCNRSTLETIEASGFSVLAVEHRRMPKAIPIVAPLIVGRALAGA